MGWHNPPVSWEQFHQRLTGAPEPPKRPEPAGPEAVEPEAVEPEAVEPWAELHCHSDLSFLDGVSSPEELVATALRLGVTTLAITDHDGLYAAARLARAAEESQGRLATVFGAELTLPGVDPGASRGGQPDPAGEHLLVLARDLPGYRRLSRVITEARLAGGHQAGPRYDRAVLAGAHDGHWAVLTGCRKGAVPAALLAGPGHTGSAAKPAGPTGRLPTEAGYRAAAARLAELVERFGPDNVLVELWHHGQPGDTVRNDALAALAADAGLATVATNQVHYARPGAARLAAALAAVRARAPLAAMDGWLPPYPAARLRGRRQLRWLDRYPGLAERTLELAAGCAFQLRLDDGALPSFEVPAGYDELGWLRRLAHQGAAARYGEGSPAWAQLEHELATVARLELAGYFLTVADIARFCRDRSIACQGRGSAANSVLCHVLGITAVDPIRYGLLFERFLSPDREGPPDIDLDIESGRREEALEYVWARYGRDRAAQVATVVTYRPRSAVRDLAAALGYAPGQRDAFADLTGLARLSAPAAPADPAVPRDGPLAEAVAHGLPPDVADLAAQALDRPRHLSIHPGGMVITSAPIGEICPVQPAATPGRTVLQWDKDDCAWAGLVKIDLLGLGMLSALRDAVELVARWYGDRLDLADLAPDDPATYAMIRRADTVGVFQIESRAQMAVLPRLRPERFYDLVVAVALIRPGPIQGGSVHPYIRRRNGEEAYEIEHPLLVPALERTHGVPLFQEQLMRIAVDAAGFTPAEADRLRQALSSRRSAERLAELRARLLTGMAERGLSAELAERVYRQIRSFADYGFPESHAISFAYLVYASAYLKCHYPAAYTAALLRNQPMGFYAPRTLVADAERHGVRVRRPHVNAVAVTELEAGPAGPVVRLGLATVRGIGAALAERIVAAGPHRDLRGFAAATGLDADRFEALAEAGALLGLPATTETAADSAASDADPADPADPTARRRALWAAGALARTAPDQLPLDEPGALAPPLPPMTGAETTLADLRATGISPGSHPVAHLRAALTAAEVLTAAQLPATAHGRRVRVAGVVTHRQRPPTAGGTVFLNLEDETGLVNVVCPPGAWARHHRLAALAPGLVVRGTLENRHGVVNLLAEHFAPLPVAGVRSRDFR